MVETHAAQPAPVQSGTDVENLRTMTIIVYALYLAAFCNGATAIVGIILAYVKRRDAIGTIYERHLDNAIEIFWLALVGGLACIPLAFLFGLGVLLAAALFIWLFYRVVKGLVHAVERRAY